MAAVARADSTDTVSIHECGVIPNCDKGSDDVKVNGKSIHRVDDPNTSHPYAPPPAGCPTHATKITKGSPNVYANGKAVARKGDPYGCGIKVTSGSGNVFCNG
jgi:uncharacterized Zn-binding protein involved in type VI secretion